MGWLQALGRTGEAPHHIYGPGFLGHFPRPFYRLQKLQIAEVLLPYALSRLTPSWLAYNTPKEKEISSNTLPRSDLGSLG
jgi:hypothetical protein